MTEKKIYIPISLIFIILMTMLSILAMALSTAQRNSYTNYPTYFARNETALNKYNYNKFINQTYLTNIKFDIYCYPYNNYGLTGKIEWKCYLGTCYNITCRNCSETCEYFWIYL